MFEPLPELSSDLDWMLQSGQVGVEILAEALVYEYYRPIYRLALAILDDPRESYLATQQSLINALLSVYSYRGQVGVQAWLFRIVLDTCRKTQQRLKLKRGLKATLPLSNSPHDFGESSPSNELDAVIWLAVDVLSDRAYYPILLKFVLGWPEKDIAPVVRSDESSVRAQLNDARKKLIEAMKRAGLPGSDLEGDQLDASLSASLHRRWPARDVPDHELDAITDEIRSHVARKGASRRRFISLKEILLTGVAIVFFAGLIWGVNALLPEDDLVQTATAQVVVGTQIVRNRTRRTPAPPAISVRPTEPLEPQAPTATPQGVFYEVLPEDTIRKIAYKLGVSLDELRRVNRIPDGADVVAGQRLLIPGSLPTSVPLEVTPVPPVLELDPPKMPSGSYDIIQLMANVNRMQTFWVDAYVIDYGPAGYVGPPLASRNQIWLSQNQFLAVYGPANGDPSEVYLRMMGDFYRSNPGSGMPWYTKIIGNVPSGSPSVDDINLVFSTLITSYPRVYLGTDLKVVGTDQVAGRETWIVDQSDSQGNLVNRFWIDTQAGFTLRSRQFGGEDHKTVLKEVKVSAIAFNIDFHQGSLFDPKLPWVGGFARDESGAPEGLNSHPFLWDEPVGHQPWAYVPPLDPFDAAQSTLTFQFSRSLDISAPTTRVDLFGDGYFLGTIPFGNPWTMICNRSSDGEKIAYVSQPARDISKNAFFNWFSLGDLGSEVHTPLGGVYVTNFAFAPDSRRIAVFGYSDQFTVGSLYILDTESGEYHQIYQEGDIKSLVWSPDGDFVGFIGREAPPHFEDSVMVVRVDTGELTYRQSIDYSKGNSTDWPMLKWGVQFPVEMGGLAACVAPSGG